jgi:hypothetical protein
MWVPALAMLTSLQHNFQPFSTKKNAESKITQQNLVTVLPSHHFGYNYGFFCGSVAIQGNHDNQNHNLVQFEC